MRFQTYILAAAAALSSTVCAQSSILSSASEAASSVVSSATGSASSRVSSATETASSSASESSESSASMTSSASAQASSSSGGSDDEEEPTTTRVYTTTYYYLKHNPTYAAVSPTLLIESVVRSTSGQSEQETFSTPSDALTVLSVTKSTYTTTWTSDNKYAAVSPTLYGTDTVTTTIGLPDLSTRELNAGAGRVAGVAAAEVGGVAAFFLGLAALL